MKSTTVFLGPNLEQQALYAACDCNGARNFERLFLLRCGLDASDSCDSFVKTHIEPDGFFSLCALGSFGGSKSEFFHRDSPNGDRVDR